MEKVCWRLKKKGPEMFGTFMLFYEFRRLYDELQTDAR